jgi:hypothetical protein
MHELSVRTKEKTTMTEHPITPCGELHAAEAGSPLLDALAAVLRNAWDVAAKAAVASPSDPFESQDDFAARVYLYADKSAAAAVVTAWLTSSPSKGACQQHEASGPDEQQGPQPSETSLPDVVQGDAA